MAGQAGMLNPPPQQLPAMHRLRACLSNRPCDRRMPCTPPGPSPVATCPPGKSTCLLAITGMRKWRWMALSSAASAACTRYSVSGAPSRMMSSAAPPPPNVLSPPAAGCKAAAGNGCAAGPQQERDAASHAVLLAGRTDKHTAHPAPSISAQRVLHLQVRPWPPCLGSGKPPRCQ